MILNWKSINPIIYGTNIQNCGGSFIKDEWIAGDTAWTFSQGLPINLTAPVWDYLAEIKTAILYWTKTVPAVMNQVIRMDIINAPR